jgi:AcrR family transcriptional regulator
LSNTDKVERRTQAQRSEQMRVRILDAAVKLLGTRGYAGFRTAEVAELAGVSRGAQTHHYPTKDALVLAALEHVFRTSSEQGLQSAHQVKSIEQTMAVLLADSVNFFFSDAFLIAVDLAIQAGRETPHGGRLREIARQYRLPVEKAWLDALVAAGVPEHLAQDLLVLSTNIVRGMAIRNLMIEDPTRFERIVKVWRTMAIDFVRAESARAAPPAALEGKSSAVL